MDNIAVCQSNDMPDSEWIKYAESFNCVFEKNFTAEFFKEKYLARDGNPSFHSLLKSDTGAVAGACSAMPMTILYKGTKIRAALLVDVFILKEHRTNPLTLMKMYRRLTQKLKECGIKSVLAVPNAVAYPYWKNVVKFSDIGDLDYWVLPIKVGNVLKKFHFLNPLSKFLSSIILSLSGGLSAFFHGKNHASYSFSIETDDEYLTRRFPPSTYTKAQRGDCKYCYRICDENGVSTAYLMYFTEKSRKTPRALNKALEDIIGENPDIIIYVGKIPFIECALLKLPRKLEPKRLPLMLDWLAESERPEGILDVREWDFGLSNYDVR